MKINNAKASTYLFFGFLLYAGEILINRLGDFTDKDFICGALTGASIILLLHGVYNLGKGFAAAKKDNENDK